jgi:hypothetical protein
VNTPSGAGDRQPAGRPTARRPSGSRDEPETEAERRFTSILIVGFILFVLGAGLWLGDALLKARRIDECVSSGRRNCAPIAVPRPPPQR